MLSDIEIAHGVEMRPIAEIAQRLGIPEDLVEPYGRYKAKIDYAALESKGKRGRLVLVTAINPTPAGEGKTTVSIGLADALALRGVDVALALREPSLGPVFGLKGGAAGGGYAQVVPMEDINLHFTGDIHAITAANNLIAALVDNSIQQGNPLGIDPRRITWRRCMDMNDRQLRSIVTGLGGRSNGTPREEGFEITTASEIMATLCLSLNMADLKRRVSRIIVARTFDDRPVTAGDLKATGAVCALLRDALKPNLVQTLAHTPAFVHGGPFANIAHGCNSVIATRTALKLADVVVTEAGFGADLGAEKFIDIKCRLSSMMPSAIVLVASIRALKSHGGVKKDDLSLESLDALDRGLANLVRHVENIRDVWNLPPVVAINRFSSDSDAEISLVEDCCRRLGVEVRMCEVWERGGQGGLDLADAVLGALDQGDRYQAHFTYPDDLSIADKIREVATRIYHADGVVFAPGVVSQMRKAEKEGFGDWPVCIAKTQYSFSDDAKLTGAPKGFRITIRAVKVSAGAGFIVAYAGDMMTMPGLPKVPAAEGIDVDDDGVITGLS